MDSTSKSKKATAPAKNKIYVGRLVTVLTGDHWGGLYGRVARVLQIVDRRVDNEEKHVRASIAVIQIPGTKAWPLTASHTISQSESVIYIIPTKDLRLALPHEKKQAKFHGEPRPTIPGADIRYVTQARPYRKSRLM